MKKTTNSNPLKFFNDAAAARSKSVIAGNNKLMKAQPGVAVTSYSDVYKDDIRKKFINAITNKASNAILNSKTEVDPGFTLPIPNNYKNIDPGFNIPIPKNYKNPDPGFYKGPENMQKKGGIVKSKKNK